MQILITSRQEITSKKGDKFVVYKGLDEDGGVVEAFLTQEQANDFAIPEKAMVSKQELSSIFAQYPVCEIEFNQRGRVFSLKA